MSNPLIKLVTYDNLPLYCPRPDKEAWNQHPMVMIPVQETGSAKCPYCGAQYELQDWDPNHSGH